MIQPLGRNVLIQPKEKETHTKGGIYIPDPSQHNNNVGTILAVGNEVDEVEVGNVVTYEKKGMLPNDDGSFMLVVDRIMYVH